MSNLLYIYGVFYHNVTDPTPVQIFLSTVKNAITFLNYSLGSYIFIDFVKGILKYCISGSYSQMNLQRL